MTEIVESDVFGRIASDLTDFIATFEPRRLRKCGADDCSLVFYDTARNATRRWCSMAACGNRHKVKRHRARGADLRRYSTSTSRRRHSASSSASVSGACTPPQVAMW